MAERRVRVRLEADVGSYTRSVDRAAAKTDRLRDRAEDFEGTYRARLVVNARQARREIDRTQVSLWALNRRFATGTIRAESFRQAVFGLTSRYGLAALTPQLSSVAGAAVDAFGVFNLLPAAMFATGGGIAALTIGLQGFGDALGKLGSDPEEFAKAVEDLAPSAREAALALNGMHEAWSEMAGAVQQELFEGSADAIEELGKDFLPALMTGIQGVAGELGDAAVAFMEFAATAETVQDTRVGLENIERATEPLARSIVNLSAVFRDMGTVGAEFLPGLSDGFADSTGRLREFIAEARETGQLADWIQDGIDRTAQLGRVTRNTGSILNSVFEGAQASGLDFLTTLEEITASADEFLDSAEGQERTVKFFSDMSGFTSAMAPGLRDLAGIFGDIIRNASESGSLVAFGDAFSSIMAAARPVADVLGDLASRVLPPLLRSIEALAPIIGPAVAAFIAFRATTSVINGVQGAVGNLATRTGLAGVQVGLLANEMRNADGSSTRYRESTRRAAGAIDGLGRGIDRLGRTLPIIGTVLVAGQIAFERYAQSADEVADAISRGDVETQKARDSFNQANNSFRGWLNLIPLAGPLLSQLVDSEEDLNRALRENEQAHAAVDRAMSRADIAGQVYRATLSELGFEHPLTQAAAERYEGAVRGVEQAQRDAGIETQSHTDKMRAQADQFLASETSGLRWIEAVVRATEEIAENGETLDLNTQKGRDNKRAIDDMARAALEDIEAKRRHGVSTREITDLTNSHRQQLFDTMLQMGASKEEAQRYIDKLNLVPPSQTTTFHTPGLAEAIRDATALGRIIDSISGTSKTPVNPGGQFTPGGILRQARGGPIHGPGSGTSDDIPAMLSNGEWVIRARSAQAQGPERMRALNEGRAEIVPREHPVGGYAHGGPVYRDAHFDFGPIASRSRAIFAEAEKMLSPTGGSAGMMRVLRRVFPGLPLISGFRPGAITATGNRSYHAQDRAVDIPPRMDVFNWIAANHGAKTKELIFSPAGGRQINNGRPHYYTGVTRGDHWDHVHWAYDKGGMLNGKGRFDKDTLRPERVLSPEQTEAFERLVDILDEYRPLPRPTPMQFQGPSMADVQQAVRDIIVNIYNPIAERASDSVQQKLGRMSSLGMFA